MSEKLNTYGITARLTLVVSINVEAKNMVEAIAKSETLREHDFVKIRGEYFDGKLEIAGVSDEERYKVDGD